MKLKIKRQKVEERAPTMAKTTSQKTETVTSRAAHNGPVEQSMLNTFHSLQTVT